MSRVATPGTTTTTTTTPSATSTPVPHELIARRAYEKWMKRGQPCGTDKQDWLEAETEIRQEMVKTPTTARR